MENPTALDLVLTSFLPLLWLCYSFKNWGLLPSLLLQNREVPSAREKSLQYLYLVFSATSQVFCTQAHLQPGRMYHQGNSYLTGKENGSPVPCGVGRGGGVLERKRAGIQTVVKNSGSVLPLPVGGGKVLENLGEARLLSMSAQTLGNFELSTQYGLRMMRKGKSLELVEVNV